MLPFGPAFLASILVYIVMLIIWLKQKKNLTSIALSSLFFFYIVAVIGVTLFPLPIEKTFIQEEIKYNHDRPNFIPFTFVQDSLAQLTPDPRSSFPYYFSVMIVLKQVGGNILLGMPFGFLAPLVWKKRNSFGKVLMAGFWFSFGIEASQFLISLLLGYTYRVTDIDDIILNCTGVALGYACFKLSTPVLRALRLKGEH